MAKISEKMTKAELMAEAKRLQAENNRLNAARRQQPNADADDGASNRDWWKIWGILALILFAIGAAVLLSNTKMDFPKFIPAGTVVADATDVTEEPAEEAAPTEAPAMVSETDDAAVEDTRLDGYDTRGGGRKEVPVMELLPYWQALSNVIDDWMHSQNIEVLDVVRDDSGLSLVLPPGLKEADILEAYDIVEAKAIWYVFKGEDKEYGSAVYAPDYIRVHLYNWPCCQ